MQTETTSKLRQIFEKILADENIDSTTALLDNFDRYYLPLTNWINAQYQSTPVIIGINGSQGSGKSTLCKILSALLINGFDKNVINLSIDDLYKTRQQRQQFAADIHPLFATRGVPGTHDTELGEFVLRQLKQKKPVRIPAFDKTIDDRVHESGWSSVSHQVDIILFEGWCVGARAEQESSLDIAINSLEEKEDSDKTWRTHVNKELEKDYQLLFSYIDKLIMLKIPDFNKVFEWRKLQENKLKAMLPPDQVDKTMSADEIKRFVMHFERITRHMLNEAPARSDVILDININHQIDKITIKDF